MNIKSITALAICFVMPLLSKAQQWQPKTAPLMSKYTQDVNPDKVLPEYPRPQMVREKWLNLNGLWQFQPGKGEKETAPEGNLSGNILVPFCVESALSGVKEHHDRLWYRRKFVIPADWQGQRVLIHFGAVDYEAEVYINGESLGIHTGGYDPFSFDITPFIKGSGPQEVTVRVFDPTDTEGIPRGKQTLTPGGIMYTSVTGIWQTVWLEPVPKTSINDIKIVPDVDKSVLRLTISTDGDAQGLSVVAKIKANNKFIKTSFGKANTEMVIPIANAKFWSPQSPFLYDLDISLKKGNKTVDVVAGYFGMRKISIKNVNGFKRIFLNNKFVFELGPLDQGFWPDGIYTAPTDGAIKNDLQTIKDLGFNMVRKHIKVEPYRWYYWADKLGLMVWQDMPSADSYVFSKPPPLDTDAFSTQLTRMIKTHWNSPCIVMWVVFNEAQGQHNTGGMVNQVRALDPSRLINQASGGYYFGAGDILDIHSYPPPGCLLSKTQAVVAGEFGGIGYNIKGHLWHEGSGYIGVTNQKDYDSLYNNYTRDLIAYKSNMGLNAGVYTQTTDVETETNGLMTYDREIIKGDPAAIRASNINVIDKDLYFKPIIPLSGKFARTWKYTFVKPGKNWNNQDFDDQSWQSGEAAFGTKSKPENVRTAWDANDIWIRQEFTPGNLSVDEKNNLVVLLHHSNDCDVFINGVKAADVGGFTSGYTVIAVSKEASRTVVNNGKNVIAIHCKQNGGTVFLDAAISVLSPQKPLRQ